MMLKSRRKRFALSIITGGTALVLTLAACSSSTGSGSADATAKQTITFLTDNSANSVALAKGLIADYKKIAPKVTITLQTRPGGTDGDNYVKTQLATGTMSDVFFYNSGSLFQGLAPEKNLVDLTNEPWQKNLDATFKTVVSAGGKVYGVPAGTAMVGAILYNKKVYADLGLSVPKTWSDFIVNSKAIKAAGKTAVIETFGDTWTSQLLVLGDFANVAAAEPNFAAQYTANKKNYANDPLAAAGFSHLAEVHADGLMNADFGSAKLADGLKMLANGTGVQYPMLTFAGATIVQSYPDLAKNIGVFAIPGQNASVNPITTWFPAAIYIPKTTKHLAAAKAFAAFVASVKGCESQTKSVGIQGPYLVKGCSLPSTVPTYVSDMLPYFNSPDGTKPALEFLSPVKGPNLENVTVAVGSGITSAADGAKQADADLRAQALQLGLPGW